MALEFRGVHAQVFADTSENIYLEGARRSGKTWLICAKIIASCLAHPGINWLACRYSNEETQTKIRPEFERICQIQGVSVEWDSDERAYLFPAVAGKISKVYCYGLKAQNLTERLSKIRGLTIAGCWVDQTEELPRDVAEELIFAKRQPGFPHQLIYTPNPVTEDSFFADLFPEDNSIETRRYYRVSLYQNDHNIPAKDLREIETLYPPTHPKYKSLVLGMRGVNVVGVPVYERVFRRGINVARLAFDESRPVFEALQYGQHHPTWLCAQRSYRGALRILGAVMGKRMFLEDFLPKVKTIRAEWFKADTLFHSCCDAPPQIGSSRFTNIYALKANGFQPVWKANSNAPDVREAVIQELAAAMRQDAFQISDDESHFLVCSQTVVKSQSDHQDITKQSKFVIDGFEAAYVWDEHKVSVGNKLVRKPKDDEWIDGAQRCLENIWLNFCAGKETDFDRDRQRARDAELSEPYRRPSVWS